MAADRIRLAAPLTLPEIEAAFADRITEETHTEVDGEGRLRAERLRRLNTLVLERRRLDAPAPEVRRAALLDHLRRLGLSALPFDAQTQRLRARVAFLAALEPHGTEPPEGSPDGEAAWPDLGEAALLACAPDWLAPLLDGVDRLADLVPGELRHALLALIPYPAQLRLEAEAPDRLTLPTGSQPVIDYAAEGGPRVEARVQELYGPGRAPNRWARPDRRTRPERRARPGRRTRPHAAHVVAAVARAPAGRGDAGPAGLLARLLARGPHRSGKPATPATPGPKTR